MTRPGPNVISSHISKNGQVWEIYQAENVYVVTYCDQPVGLRVVESLGGVFKYKKMTYTSLGSARRQARMLNEKFNCNDFDVMMIGDSYEV